MPWLRELGGLSTLKGMTQDFKNPLKPIPVVVLLAGLAWCCQSPPSQGETYVCSTDEDCLAGYRCASSPTNLEPERRVCLSNATPEDTTEPQDTGSPEVEETRVDVEEDLPEDGDTQEDEELPTEPKCGDGTLDEGEACDDANLRSHDGCSSGCTLETPRWERVETPNAPEARDQIALAYDRERQRVVLFGGLINGKYQDDTWEYDGKTWVETSPDVSPSPRVDHALIYDAAHKAIILYGGLTNDSGVNPSRGIHDTWMYDGARWQELTLTQAPDVNRNMQLSFDPVLRRPLLFGGFEFYWEDGEPVRTVREGLWELDIEGNTWLDRTPIETTPNPRTLSGWAYDTRRGAHILFGGFPEWHYPDGVAYEDTWAYDSQTETWTRLDLSGALEGRGTSMVFHEAIGRSVVFSGLKAWPDRALGTWEFDDTWERSAAVEPEPGLRRFHALTYDSHRKRVVLFGGYTSGPDGALSDTWEYYYDSDWPDEQCRNGLDDDSDGLPGCTDPDCDEAVECRGVLPP